MLLYDYNGRLINGRVWAFFTPAFISTLSITASMFLDVVIVGRMLGPTAMGAVNLALPLTMVFTMVHMLFGTGGEVIVAAAKGAQDNDTADKIFTLSMLIIVSVGLLLMVGGLAARDGIAESLSRGNKEMEPIVAQYIHYMFICAPIMIGVTGMTYFIKTDALPKFAACVAIVANVVNIISKIIYLGPMKLGIEGAAFGTITGYVVGLLFVSMYIFSRRKRVLNFVSIGRLPFAKSWDIFVTGLPSSLGQGLGALTTFATNAIILSVAGKPGVVAFTLCASCSIFLSTFRYAAMGAMTPIIGALYGEHDWWSMHYAAVKLTKVVMTCVGVCVILIEIFADNIFRFFGVHDEAMIAFGVPGLRIYMVSIILGVLVHILMSYMQITRRKVFSITISAATELVGVACMYVMSKIFGVTGLWLSTSVSLIIILGYIWLGTRYIAAKSNGTLHGIFMHEIQPDFVIGNTIKTNEHDAKDYPNTMLREFLTGYGLSAPAVDEAVSLTTKAALGITAKNKKENSTADIMTLIGSEFINIRLRDDGPQFPTPKEEDDKITHFSVMGYNDTFIRVPKTFGGVA